jgi:hypothetical protein
VRTGLWVTPSLELYLRIMQLILRYQSNPLPVTSKERLEMCSSEHNVLVYSDLQTSNVNY